MADERSSPVTAAGQHRIYTGLPREELSRFNGSAGAMQARRLARSTFIFTSSACHGLAYLDAVVSP